MEKVDSRRVVNVPKDMVSYVEACDRSAAALKDLIISAAERGLDLTPQGKAAYDRFLEEYKEAHTEFNLAKNAIEEQYVKTAVSNPCTWELDYASGRLYISETT